MRLFTHNFLQCHAKGCTQDNFPLPITEAKLERRETELNHDFINSFLHKIEWEALLKTVQQLGMEVQLPSEKPDGPVSEEIAQQLHTILFETYVKDGLMTCQGCGHVYAIRDGIPNMLLAEDEV
jgi:multifunctional methyltransferase subunit TRM112